MQVDFYPPSPTEVPSDLIKTTNAYHSRVFLVLLSIFLFIALFFSLVFVAGYGVYYSIYKIEFTFNSLYYFLFRGGIIAIAIMFFLFTLKFLFKRNNFDNPTNVELKEKDHPKLFQFIRNLCNETGAPFPKKVVVNEQINAAVFYNNTILSIFLPVRKNLLIGLGLVNSLSLSEFKAVLAHEFGHFSQRSMKLGSYVYMANRIIHDMVFSRDKWDEILEGWSRSDPRFAIFAWILMAFVWVIRNLLILVYKLINLIHASLSREMEFNADLVAVSVTGSDQIINGLSKLKRSNDAMQMAFNQLMDAADHNLYSNNLFFHQKEAESFLRDHREGYKDRFTTSSDTGKRMIFSSNEVEIPNMYASHPPNYDREVNAKETYINGVSDKRSPWILFDQPEILQQEVTQKIYQNSSLMTDEDKFSSPNKVAEFINQELQETFYDKKYLDTYSNRYINQYPDIEKAMEFVATHYQNSSQIATDFSELYGAEFKEQAEIRKNIFEDIKTVEQFSMAQKKSFVFNDKNYTFKDIPQIMEELTEKINQQYDNWFLPFDKKVFHLHLAMATEANHEKKDEYIERCVFQNSIIKSILLLETAVNNFIATIHQAQMAGELTEVDIAQIERTLNESHQIVNQVLTESENLEIPELAYIEKQELRPFLLEQQLIRGGHNLLRDTWINYFSEQSHKVMNRLVFAVN